MNKSQKGRSMIEMLGVLGIMAVITVLGLTAYKVANRRIKINKLKDEVNKIVIHTRKICPDRVCEKLGQNGWSVTGFEKTFEDFFIDTGLFKENITPFGGKYKLLTVREGDAAYYPDAPVLLEVGGPNEMASEDCNAILNEKYGEKYRWELRETTGWNRCAFLFFDVF